MAWLDGVESVAWETLEHAYGPATDVPALLAALDDPAQLDATAYTLYGNVFHQGSRYEVTPFVVPFLAARLREGASDPALAEFLISYLAHLAVGYPTDLFPRLYRPDEWVIEFDDAAALKLRAEIAGRPWREREADMGRLDRHWAMASYFAVEAHLDAVLPYLEAAEPTVRDEACALLSWFPRKVATVRGALEAAADARNEGAPILALARLGADVRARVARGLAHESRAQRVLTATAAALAVPPVVDDDVVRELTTPLGDLAETPSPFADTLASTAGAGLAALGPEHRDVVARALALAHVDANPMVTLHLTRQLFECLFVDGRPPQKASNLDATARAALAYVADHGGWSIPKGGDRVFANYGELVAAFGFPRRRAEFRAWLEE